MMMMVVMMMLEMDVDSGDENFVDDHWVTDGVKDYREYSKMPYEVRHHHHHTSCSRIWCRCWMQWLPQTR